MEPLEKWLVMVNNQSNVGDTVIAFNLIINAIKMSSIHNLNCSIIPAPEGLAMHSNESW
jgi:hypothetical protein